IDHRLLGSLSEIDDFQSPVAKGSLSLDMYPGAIRPPSGHAASHRIDGAGGRHFSVAAKFAADRTHSLKPPVVAGRNAKSLPAPCSLESKHAQTRTLLASRRPNDRITRIK